MNLLFQAWDLYHLFLEKFKPMAMTSSGVFKSYFTFRASVFLLKEELIWLQCSFLGCDKEGTLRVTHGVS